MRRQSISERKQALREQGCCNCGQPYGDQSNWYCRIELDHIEPWAKNPNQDPNDFDNMQPLCGRCNRYKGTYTYEELNLHVIPDYPKDFDWEALAWITWEYHPDDQEQVRELKQRGEFFRFMDTPEWDVMAARKIKTHKPALWIHGELFDVPIWPHEAADVRVPLHEAPQYYEPREQVMDEFANPERN